MSRIDLNFILSREEIQDIDELLCSGSVPPRRKPLAFIDEDMDKDEFLQKIQLCCLYRKKDPLDSTFWTVMPFRDQGIEYILGLTQEQLFSVLNNDHKKTVLKKAF